jgi:phage protein D
MARTETENMLTPAYKLTIGKKLVDTTKEPKASTVTELRVELDMDAPADRVLLVLGQVNGLKPAPDDQAIVELGYADDTSGLLQVMTGSVITVEPGLTTNRVVAHTAAHALLRSFKDKTFESKTAGEIVQDLCNDASVDVEKAEDGISFPAYVVDGRRNFFRHMRDLADLCGFDVYFNSEGKLVFQKFQNGNNLHTFEFAKHVVELKVVRKQVFADAVQAFGESPTSTQGESSAFWLTKDFGNSKGSAGSGSPEVLLERSALRTSEAAQTAADAAEKELQRGTLRGWVLALGSPQVQLGDAIKFQSMPEATLNTTFQVRSVVHSITKYGGFTTKVGFRTIDTAPAAAGL